jgi:hypothetical protein
MLTGLGALLRPALVYVLPLFWVLAGCAALVIGMFAWCDIAGWVAIAISCLIVELRADMEPRRKQARRG